MFKPTTYTVPAERAGTKLDRLIQDMAQLSRREARLLIAQGRIRVNRRAVRILARPINAGAQIDIMPGAADDATGAKTERRTEARRIALPEVLYLDRWVVVLNKPAGLLSETDRFNSPSLQTLVPKVLRARGEHDKLWLVHRLDAGTSGVIIMARTPGAAAHLSASFREATARKTYVALCSGALEKTHEVDAPIARAQGTQHHVASAGKPAQTRITPLAAARDATLVRCQPKTGRTHQIRVHLVHLGHPIIGDRLYGGPGYSPADSQHMPIARAMLHALQLDIAHPKEDRRLRVQAPVPQDFVTTGRYFGIDVAANLPVVAQGG